MKLYRQFFTSISVLSNVYCLRSTDMLSRPMIYHGHTFHARNDITSSTGAVHSGSDNGEEYTLRSYLNSAVHLPKAFVGGRHSSAVSQSQSAIPNLELDKYKFKQVYDTDEASSLASDQVPFSDDGEH